MLLLLLLLRLIVLDAQITLLKFILKHITNGKLASAPCLMVIEIETRS